MSESAAMAGNSTSIAASDEDAAWVSVDLPLPPGELFASLQNLERLFRLNPYLEIKSWQEENPGQLYLGKQVRLESVNEMNGLRQSATLIVTGLQPGASFTLGYAGGLKQATVVSVQELAPSSSRLVVKDCYPAQIDAAEREARASEVDKSLVPWGASIRHYFLRRARWGWLPFYGWFQDRFWLKMPPRQRRIARLIIWTTALEFVVFLFVFVIYWLELARGHL
ncbi:MAG: hypothetical protein Q8S05_03615 [Sulfuricella sp.]|nr:hypothetical protein [Sulfuricella sp.]